MNKTTGAPEQAELEHLAQGAGTALVGKVAGSGLRYGSLILLARLLAPSQFGLYALGLAVYQLAETLASLGLPQGIVRSVVVFHQRREHALLRGVLSDGGTLALGCGLLLSAALFLSAPWISHLFSGGGVQLIYALRLFALGVPFGAASLVLATATTGFQTANYYVVVRELFQPLSYMVLIAVLYLLGGGMLLAVGAWSLSALLTLVLIFLVLKRVLPSGARPRRPPPSQRRSLLQVSFPLLLGNLTGFVFLWTDTLTLGYFRSPSQVGIYRAAAQTALLLTFFLTAIGTIFGPKIASLHHADEMDKLGWLFQKTTQWSVLLTLPAYLLLATSGNDILGLFGPEFARGDLPLTILALAQFINAATGSVGYVLIMTGKTYHYLTGDLCLLGTNVLLNLALIPQWGGTGAALATGVSLVVLNLIRLAQVHRLFGFQPYTWIHLKLFGLAGGIILSGWAFSRWMPPLPPTLTLAINVLFIGGVYLGGGIALGLGGEFKSLWNSLPKGLLRRA